MHKNSKYNHVEIKNIISALSQKYNNIMFTKDSLELHDIFQDHKISYLMKNGYEELSLSNNEDNINIVNYLNVERDILFFYYLPNKIKINNTLIMDCEIAFHANDFSKLEMYLRNGKIKSLTDFDEFSPAIRDKVEIFVWAFRKLQDFRIYIDTQYERLYFFIQRFFQQGEDYYSIFQEFLTEKERKLNKLRVELDLSIDIEDYRKASKIKKQIDMLLQ